MFRPSKALVALVLGLGIFSALTWPQRGAVRERAARGWVTVSRGATQIGQWAAPAPKPQPTTPAALSLLEGTAQASPYPNGQYGKVTLSAATATAIPTSSLANRQAIAIYNLGGATVYCGYDSSVTTSTGFPIPSNGSLSIGVSYNEATTLVKVYCIATNAQTAPNDLRYMEIL